MTASNVDLQHRLINVDQEALETKALREPVDTLSAGLQALAKDTHDFIDNYNDHMVRVASRVVRAESDAISHTNRWRSYHQSQIRNKQRVVRDLLSFHDQLRRAPEERVGAEHPRCACWS